MDTTELHYVTYDPDAIWEAMMLAYIGAGGDVLYPGDEKEILLRSVQADIVQAFAGVDNALRMHTLRYAVGDYLDLIGELRGCARIEATKAKATVTITAKATGVTDTLEAGTAMTADGESFYLLDEDLTLTGYRQTATVPVTCERAGTAGNSLTAGTQLQLAVTNDNIESIVAASDAAGGDSREDDETYRARIRTYMLTAVTTGPQQQYEAVAKSVSSTILDAKAVNGGAGQVNVYLILSTQTGAAALLAEVAAALSAKDVRPLTDTVSVSQATDVEYTLNVLYQSDGSASVTSAVNAAALEYQNWQDNTIGRAFNPDRLMAALYQAGATLVTWDTGSAFDGGSVEYTPITDAQRCKGTITLTQEQEA